MREGWTAATSQMMVSFKDVAKTVKGTRIKPVPTAEGQLTVTSGYKLPCCVDAALCFIGRGS